MDFHMVFWKHWTWARVFGLNWTGLKCTISTQKRLKVQSSVSGPKNTRLGPFPKCLFTLLAKETIRAIPLKRLVVGVTTLNFADHPTTESHLFSDHPPAESPFYVHHPPAESQNFLDHPPVESQNFLDHPPAEFF